MQLQSALTFALCLFSLTDGTLARKHGKKPNKSDKSSLPKFNIKPDSSMLKRHIASFGSSAQISDKSVLSGMSNDGLAYISIKAVDQLVDRTTNKSALPEYIYTLASNNRLVFGSALKNEFDEYYLGESGDQALSASLKQCGEEMMKKKTPWDCGVQNVLDMALGVDGKANANTLGKSLKMTAVKISDKGVKLEIVDPCSTSADQASCQKLLQQFKVASVKKAKQDFSKVKTYAPVEDKFKKASRKVKIVATARDCKT